MPLQRITSVLGVIVIMGWLVSREEATPRAQGPTTFSEHVAPIVFANCTSCHRPGEAAPFSLMSYRDARPLAKAIASATAAHVMPPWKAGPSDYAFANARQLSADQIATILGAGAEPQAMAEILAHFRVGAARALGLADAEAALLMEIDRAQEGLLDEEAARELRRARPSLAV